ncbi:MAG TPA: hypothetical protein VE999_03025 [Gemmataceae bacterium]|nr:hypothetical protein [Gemmataceae bacterium]
MAEEAGEFVPKGSAVLPEIPAELGVHPLLLAVLHAVIFLDGSDEDAVHPDAALEALEYMAAYLQRLSGVELRRVQEDLHVLAAFARQENWPKQHIRFFKEFLSNFGIGEKEEA